MSAYKLIDAEKASFPVAVSCEVLGVSRSGYYAAVETDLRRGELGRTLLLPSRFARSTGAAERPTARRECTPG